MTGLTLPSTQPDLCIIIRYHHSLLLYPLSSPNRNLSLVSFEFHRTSYTLSTVSPRNLTCEPFRLRSRPTRTLAFYRPSHIPSTLVFISSTTSSRSPKSQMSVNPSEPPNLFFIIVVRKVTTRNLCAQIISHSHSPCPYLQPYSSRAHLS